MQLLAEHAGEVARAHVHPRRQAFDVEVLAEMLGDPLDQVGEAFAAAGLAGEQLAELRLPARPLHEHHHVPRHLHGAGMAVVFLEQGQHQVDAGGDAGGGPELAVVDEDRVFFNHQFGMAAAQFLAVFPVGGDTAPRQQAGGGEHESAGADRADAPRGGGGGADPVEQLVVLHRLVAAGAAADDEGVDAARVRQRLGQHGEAGAGVEQAALARDHAHGVGRLLGAAEQHVVGGEHLHGAGDVQQQRVLVGEDHHGAGFSGHGAMSLKEGYWSFTLEEWNATLPSRKFPSPPFTPSAPKDQRSIRCVLSSPGSWAACITAGW